MALTNEERNELIMLLDKFMKDEATQEQKEMIFSFNKSLVDCEKKENGNIIRKGLELKVTNYIHELGVPAHLMGYHYLREAVIMTVENHERVTMITKLLYPDIAKSHKTTAEKVERAIRHAIEVSWSRGSVEFQNKLFGYDADTNSEVRPTNSEFIAFIAEYVKLNY